MDEDITFALMNPSTSSLMCFQKEASIIQDSNLESKSSEDDAKILSFPFAVFELNVERPGRLEGKDNSSMCVL